MFFNKKVMLQNTQEEEKQTLENCNSDEHVVQMELETHDVKDSTKKVGISSSED